MSPILVKTLDANLQVDVRTWDWIMAQVRDIGSNYLLIAVILALLTVFVVYAFSRPSGPSGSSRSGGPVIGDLDQNDRR